MTILEQWKSLERRVGGPVDRALDWQFALLCRQPPARMALILGLGLVVPWAIMFAAAADASPPVFPMIEVGLMAVLIGTLALVVPRLARGRARLVLIGYFVFLVNFVVAEFAYIYSSLSLSEADAFTEPLTRFESAYLAVGTFTTVGGGIDPLSSAARAAVMAQSVIGFLIVVVGVALVLAPPSLGSSDVDSAD